MFILGIKFIIVNVIFYTNYLKTSNYSYSNKLACYNFLVKNIRYLKSTFVFEACAFCFL